MGIFFISLSRIYIAKRSLISTSAHEKQKHKKLESPLGCRQSTKWFVPWVADSRPSGLSLGLPTVDQVVCPLGCRQSTKWFVPWVAGSRPSGLSLDLLVSQSCDICDVLARGLAFEAEQTVSGCEINQSVHIQILDQWFFFFMVELNIYFITDFCLVEITVRAQPPNYLSYWTYYPSPILFTTITKHALLKFT